MTPMPFCLLMSLIWISTFLDFLNRLHLSRLELHIRRDPRSAVLPRHATEDLPNRNPNRYLNRHLGQGLNLCLI